MMVAHLNERQSSGEQNPSGDSKGADAAAKNALSRLEKEWKLRIHDRLLKIMDLSLDRDDRGSRRP